MSVLDLLVSEGSPPRTVPSLQLWLISMFANMQPVSHMQFGSGAGIPSSTTLNALFPGEKDKGIAVWENTTDSKVYLFYNNNGTWIQYVGPALVGADEVPYTPGDGGDWVNPDPDDVEEALDTLAARRIAATAYAVVITVNTSVSSTTFVDVTGSSISHTFTKPNALVIAHGISNAGVAANEANIRLNIAGGAGSIYGGQRQTTYHTSKVSETINSASYIGAGAQTIKLQINRTLSGTAGFLARVSIGYMILEWD